MRAWPTHSVNERVLSAERRQLLLLLLRARARSRRSPCGGGGGLAYRTL